MMMKKQEYSGIGCSKRRNRGYDADAESQYQSEESNDGLMSRPMKRRRSSKSGSSAHGGQTIPASSIGMGMLEDSGCTNNLESRSWSSSVMRDANKAGVGLISLGIDSPPVSELDTQGSFHNVFDKTERT